MKRLSLEMEDELHKAIKTIALKKDVSMKEYITDLIEEDLEKEKKKRI